MRAFVTAEQIEKWKLMYVGDVVKYTGRGLCSSRGVTYVNGAQLVGGVWQGPGDDGAKVHINPDEIAGIELYKHVAEAPARFNATRRRGEDPGCITVIWLK
jgi:hypothetical protein